MARLIKHEENGPKEIKTEHGDSVWVCMCGLTKNKPLCDGAHKKTHDEKSGKTYMYDDEKCVEV